MENYDFYYQNSNTNTNTNINYDNWSILNNPNYQSAVNGNYTIYNENNDSYNYNYNQTYNTEQYSNSTNANVSYNFNNNYDYNATTNNNENLNIYETNNDYNNYGQYNNFKNFNNYEQNKKNESYNYNEQNYNYGQNNTFSTNLDTAQNNFVYNNYNNEFFVQNDNQNDYSNYITYPQTSNNKNNIINNTTENINHNDIYNIGNYNDFNNINYNFNDKNINDNSNQNIYEEYEYKYDYYYDSNYNIHYKRIPIPKKKNNNNIIIINNNQNVNTYNSENSINMQSRNSAQPYSKTLEKIDIDSESIIKKSNTVIYSDPTSFQNKEEKKAPTNQINTITTIENQPPQKTNELQARVIDLQTTTQIPSQPEPQNKKINFNFNGLINIGSTCYMNATLQCLLHVNELVEYFLKELPNDFKSLCQKNSQVPSKGEISKAFYQLIKGVYPQNDEKSPFNSKTFGSGNNKPVSPDNFQRVLGFYNSQFRNFEANDSKDLILYLLQTIHAELNYFGDVSINLRQPNQYDRVNTFQFFIFSYEKTNFSIISKIFYGTYENMTKCRECKKDLYNYQKFEFISFSMFDYKGKIFNIYNGFEDNQKMSLLAGDNQFHCNNCKKLCDAELYSKIIFPPNKLLINIDYGKNKKFTPSSVKFGEEIDITKYVNFNFGVPIKYRLIGICTHYGSSGSYGHYIAYCKHPSGRWFIFNDSLVSECSKNNIYGGSPYLLLYEKINYS